MLCRHVRPFLASRKICIRLGIGIVRMRGLIHPNTLCVCVDLTEAQVAPRDAHKYPQVADAPLPICNPGPPRKRRRASTSFASA